MLTYGSQRVDEVATANCSSLQMHGVDASLGATHDSGLGGAVGEGWWRIGGHGRRTARGRGRRWPAGLSDEDEVGGAVEE